MGPRDKCKCRCSSDPQGPQGSNFGPRGSYVNLNFNVFFDGAPGVNQNPPRGPGVKEKNKARIFEKFIEFDFCGKYMTFLFFDFSPQN